MKAATGGVQSADPTSEHVLGLERAVAFDFYGVESGLPSRSAPPPHDLKPEFEYFAASPTPSKINLTAHASPPPWQRYPNALIDVHAEGDEL